MTSPLTVDPISVTDSRITGPHSITCWSVHMYHHGVHTVQCVVETGLLAHNS